MYKVAVIGLVAIFACLQYRLWVADGGYSEVHRLSGQIAEIEDHNHDLAARNQAQEAEIADLKNGQAAMEGRARTDLGMIRADEQFYLLAEHDTP